MKLAQVLLVNVAVVAVALVIYDQFRSDASAPSQKRTAGRTAVTDTGPLEKRIAALETRLATLMWETEPVAAEAPVEEKRDPEPVALPAMEDKRSTGKPTEAEVARFRELQAAVRRQEQIKKNWKRVENALSGLPVKLTTTQRKKVHAAFADFEPQVNVIWGAIKTQARETAAAGGEVDRGQLVTQGITQIQQEFAATLTGFLDHQADAQAVAAALHPAPDWGGKR